MSEAKVHIGTSGWHYKHWLGQFYPAETRVSEMLSFYSRHFDTVEINNSFYALPKKQTVEKWRETVPSNFTFSVKASRFITHVKKLQNCEEPLSNFMEIVSGLKQKLGPILFQFPPAWKLNLERLQIFLKLLPAEYRYAFEFRNHTWHVPAVFNILNENNIAFCIYDQAGLQTPFSTTANFVYIRFHGAPASHQGNYSQELLLPWAERIQGWMGMLVAVFVYFNNDWEGHAIRNAKQLKMLLGID